MRFLPLLVLYGLIVWGVVAMVTHSSTPWTHPNFSRVGWRLLLYPAVLLTLVLLGFAGFSFIIDLGIAPVVMFLPLIVVIYGLGVLKLAMVLVGDLLRVIRNPTKEKTLED